MSDLTKILNEIFERLSRIEERLTLIETKSHQLAEYGQKMDHHIDFVDGVYQMVKKPFHGLMNYVGRYPVIKDQPTLEIKSVSCPITCEDFDFEAEMKNELLLELSEDF